MDKQTNAIDAKADHSGIDRIRIDRIRAAREELRIADAKREKLQADHDTKEELAELERKAANAKAIAAAEEEYGVGEIAVIEARAGCVIVRPPKRSHYARFRDKGAHKSEDLEKLVRSCLVYPDAGALDAILDRQQGVLDVCANAVIKLAGFRDSEVSGK